MKRSAPKRRAWLKRYAPPKQESAKRRAQRKRRQAVRAEVLERDGYRCRAAGMPGVGPCFGPLEVDEIVSRARGGNPLDPEACQTLCRGHNQWKEDHPREALALGLAGHSWDR